MFTVGFTPETAMSTPGSIQINVPLWYAYYDIELGEEVDQYPNGEDAFACSSDTFGAFVMSTSAGGVIKLDYTEILGAATDPVVIVCTNWRNPIWPKVVSGFYIRTLDEHGDLMDKSISLDLDASGLLPDVILDEHLSLELSVPATG